MSDEDVIDLEEFFTFSLPYSRVETVLSSLTFAHIRLGQVESIEAEQTRIEILLTHDEILDQVKDQVGETR